MGAVYLARHTGDFSHSVAIKMIRRGMDSDLVVRRFRHERQMLASLNHPHIARLFDGGTTAEGLPYFVMEYIDGAPIDRYADDRRLNVADRMRLCLAVFDAVQHAHDRQIIHRDLKPGQRAGDRRRPDQAARFRHREVAGLRHRRRFDDDLAGAADDAGVRQPRADSRRHDHARHRRLRARPVDVRTADRASAVSVRPAHA